MDKIFIVKWYTWNSWIPYAKLLVEAENRNQALDIATQREKYPFCRHMSVHRPWNLFFQAAEFNPHFDETAEVPIQELHEESNYSEMVEQATSSARKFAGNALEGSLEKGGRLATGIRQQIAPPQSSGWATVHRILAVICLLMVVLGVITFFNADSKTEEAGAGALIKNGMIAASALFFMAFLIDVLTDMRHYLKTIAEKE